MLTIGQVARMAGTTVRAVRHYHQTGVLPEPPRGENGYRRYRASDLDRLLRVRQLSELGVSLADVRRLVSATADERRAALEVLDEQYAEEQRVIAARRAVLADLLAGEGDPTLPRVYREYAPGLRSGGVPDELMDLDASLLRVVTAAAAGAEGHAIEEQLAGLAMDENALARSAGYMRRLAEIASLSPDDPAVATLADEYAAFLREQWPDLVDQSRDATPDPIVAWTIGDLLGETLTPAQHRALDLVMQGFGDAAPASVETGR